MYFVQKITTMKLLIHLLTSVLLFSACGGSESSLDNEKQALLDKGEMIKKTGKANTAIEYNDGIIGLQAQIITEMIAVMKLESKEPVADLKHLVNTIKECRSALQRLEVYEGGEAMKASADSLFVFYLRACEGPWLEAYTIFENSKGAMSKDDQDRFAELLEKGGEGESDYDKEFEKAQLEFARMHNFEIGANAIQEDVDKISE
jgi:hypothetical protein